MYIWTSIQFEKFSIYKENLTAKFLEDWMKNALYTEKIINNIQR